MSYAMMVFGDLDFAPAAMAPYLAHLVEPARHGDWFGNLSVHVASEPRTVGALIPWLKNAVSAEAGSWLSFQLDERSGQLKLHGMLSEDDFYDFGVMLAELFRVAGDLGADGALWFLEEQVMLFGEQDPGLSYLVKVSPKGANVVHPSTAAQRRAMQSEGFREVAERVAASLDEQTREDLRRMWGRSASSETLPLTGKKPARPRR